MSSCTGIVHQFHMMIFFTFAFAVHTFKFELYQSDSHRLSFNSPNLSKNDIILNVITRSVNISNVTPNIMTHFMENSPFYYIKIRIGTPPVEAFAAIDTGSEQTWIQCQPCIHCMPQTTPLFNPLVSSSYSKISCGPEKTCPSKEMNKCQNGFCHYQFQYSDGSYSKGMFSIDKMRIESTFNNDVIEIPNYIFGCGNDNFNRHKDKLSAIVGLAVGPHSLISQLGMQRFSYCLIPNLMKQKIGHIRFGSDANVQGIGTVIIPLVERHPHYLYFMTIEAFTVGTKRIEFKNLHGKVEEGNTCIDSGTTVSRLPYEVYDQLQDAVKMQVSASPVFENVLDGLCYRRHNTLKLPKIVVHFRGGDVTLRRYNAFPTFSSIECLAFIGHDSDVVIYGNIAQQNFIVAYDILRRTVSFKPFRCTKF